MPAEPDRRRRSARRALTRAVGVVVALCLTVAGTSGTADAFPQPGQSLSVSSGADFTSFTIQLATGDNFCPGDATTAGGGWRWHQYLVSRNVDVRTVSFLGTGPVLPAGAPAGAIAQPLFSTTGTPQVARTSLAAGTGQITGATTLNFIENVGIGLPPGEYNIGYVCTQGGVVDRYWETPITIINGGGFIVWERGWVPVAPTGLMATLGNQSIVGSFSPVTADPPVTSYAVSATPVGGGPTTTVSVPGSGPFTFTITGLVNGTTYAVTVRAANAAGSGPPSAPTLATPASELPPPSVTVNLSSVTLNLPQPTMDGAALFWYFVTISGSSGQIGASFIRPFTVAVTYSLPVGCYTIVVQATFTNLSTGDPSTLEFCVPPPPVLVQDITVTRPAGALVLTQRCGVNGSAAAYDDPVIGLLPAIPETSGADPIGGWYQFDQVTGGTAPNQVPDAGAITPNGSPAIPVAPGWTTALPPWASATLDTANFDEYPYPVVDEPLNPTEPAGTGVAGTPNPFYPTRCGIDLGTAELLTSGPRAGQFFWATGTLNQITVVNTQDADNGWTLNGRMSNFVSTVDAGDFFSGNLLGWNPEVTWHSRTNFDLYGMEVSAGDVRQPAPTTAVGGLGDASNGTNTLRSTSLARAPSLAENKFSPAATSTGSLGMAVIDARIRLLIPVTADAGTYKGTLTFTAI